MRRAHPGWGPRTILFWLDRDGCGAVAGAHVGGAVPDPSRAGHPAGPEAEAVGLQAVGAVAGDGVVADGHRRRGPHRRRAARRRSCRGSMTTRRFVVSARVVARATARPVCDALDVRDAARMGCPTQILTDNGKVFTARFGPGPGPVLFDRICIDNGIKHLLTAPRSPTTTGKVERWHKTLRREFLDGKVFDSIERRPGPARRVGAALQPRAAAPVDRTGAADRTVPARRADAGSRPSRSPRRPRRREPVTTRRVSAKGTIGFATVSYKAGAWLAGQTVEVVCEGGLVQIHHRGVLDRDPRPPAPARQADRRRAARPPAAAVAAVGVGARR